MSDRPLLNEPSRSLSPKRNAGRKISFRIGSSPKSVRHVHIDEMAPLGSQEDLDEQPTVPHSDNVIEDAHYEQLESSALTQNCPLNDQMLMELYSLRHNDGADVWFQTGRWIKYEEVLEGLDRHWGKAHLPCLLGDTFPGMVKMARNSLMLCDVKCTTYEEICLLIVNKMDGEVKEDVKGRLANILGLPQVTASRRLPRNSTVTGDIGRIGRSHSTTPAFQKRYSYDVERMAREKDNPTFRASTRSQSRNADDQAWSNRKRSSFGELGRRMSRFEKIVAPMNFETRESAQVYVGEVPEWERARMIFVRLASATPLLGIGDSPVPVRFLVFILGPPCELLYNEIGRSFCTMMTNPHFKSLAYAAKSGEQLIQGIHSFLNESVVLPPGEIESKRLIQGDDIKKFINKRQHRKDMKEEIARVQIGQENGKSVSVSPRKRLRIFDGMIDDIVNRVQHIRSDWTDGFQCQALKAVLYMFLATITPTLTFGGLMGKYTDSSMGMIETLIAQSMTGILFSIFSAQPLMIVSPTGPVLIYEGSLWILCHQMGIDFMTMRLFTGIWLFIIAFLIVAFDGARMMKYVTRFIEEIFAALISVIFIAEVFGYLRQVHRDNPVGDYSLYYGEHRDCGANATADMVQAGCHLSKPNKFLLTIIVLFGTFGLAIFFFLVRQRFWAGRFFRNIAGDFGVLLAIVIVAAGTHFWFGDSILTMLELPTKIGFTNPMKRQHGFIILPTGDNLWIAFLCASLAGLLLLILIFVETEITECLLSRKERKMVKGSGMHWDLMLMAIATVVCSLLGLPWMCAAAVQSLAHVTALTVFEKRPPGEQDAPLRVIEQRFTGLAISIFIGLFAMYGKFVSLPKPSLFGVFLYLGVMNLRGVQLVQRLPLLWMPAKHHPNVSYVTQVSTNRMKSYTVIQILLIALVFSLKQFKTTAVFFPLVLLMYIVFRQTVLTRCFTPTELQALDGDEEDQSEPCDFYGKSSIPV